MASYDYNLVVIGGGPAGEKGAAQVAYFGLDGSVIPESCKPRAKGDFKVAMVEREPVLGGACINTGTLASKTLRESALFLSGARSRQLSGGVETRVKDNITLADFMFREQMVLEKERDRARRNMERHKVDVIQGTASFLDPHRLEIALPDGRKREISSEFFLIAVGSSPARPAFIPFNDENVFDSDTILSMPRLPKSLLVIGGGVIGCEYACLFQALGLKVSLMNRSARVMEFIDNEITDALMSSCRKMGMELVMNDEVESCVNEGKQVRTRTKSGREIVTEALLYAAGRGGNTGGLNLDKLGIQVGRFGNIEKFDPVTYQTTVPNIYAAGDVIGRPALASTSMEQGRLAMCHAFNIRYRGLELDQILPAGVYTIPEISCVGESEEGIQRLNKEKGSNVRYVVGRSRFGDHARGQIIGDAEGMVKMIFSVPEGRLLGCQVIGEIASEIVHVAMTCMQFQGDISYFLNTVFNYPTLCDVYKYAAYDALGKLNKARAEPA